MVVVAIECASILLLVLRAGAFGLRLLVGPEAVSGQVDEDVFKRGLGDGDGFDLARESLAHFDTEAMSLGAAEAYLVLEHRWRDAKALRDARRQQFGIAR